VKNARDHYGYAFEDPFVSRRPVAVARTWLLRRVPL
jgi:hypothetical protein